MEFVEEDVEEGIGLSSSCGEGVATCVAIEVGDDEK